MFAYEVGSKVDVEKIQNFYRYFIQNNSHRAFDALYFFSSINYTYSKQDALLAKSLKSFPQLYAY